VFVAKLTFMRAALLPQIVSCQRDPRIRILLEALAAAVVFSAIMFLLQWRYGLSLSDEGFLWFLSQRAELGQMAIRDFHSYDPGRYLWSAAWFKLLGGDGLLDQRIANAAFGVLGLTAAYAAMAASGFGRWLRMATIVMLAMALGFPQHKIYEQALSLIGVTMLARALRDPGDKNRWFVCGIATGVAAIIGRNSGLYFAIGTVIALGCFWRWRRAETPASLVAYAQGMAVGYTPMIVWFVLDGRFRETMVQSVLFTPQWQLSLPIPFPWRVAQDLHTVGSIQTTAVSWLCIAVIVIYSETAFRLAVLLGNARTMDNVQRLEAAAVCVGVPYLHQAFDRADFSHIAQGILPAFFIAAAQLRRTTLSRAGSVAFSCLVLVAWIPSEPRVAQSLIFRRNPGSLVHFDIDGSDFVVQRNLADLLQRVRKEFDACRAGPDHFLAMPQFPGLYAYLHADSPHWETYYLWHRSPEFQKREISQLEEHGTKLVIMNEAVTVDGRVDLRIQGTNPLLVRYIKDHFQPLPAESRAPDDFAFFERGCTR
jgi:hypothetical protein